MTLAIAQTTPAFCDSCTVARAVARFELPGVRDGNKVLTLELCGHHTNMYRPALVNNRWREYALAQPEDMPL